MYKTRSPKPETPTAKNCRELVATKGSSSYFQKVDKLMDKLNRLVGLTKVLQALILPLVSREWRNGVQ